MPFLNRLSRRHRHRGQSLTELALLLPVVLLVVLVTLDFGRAMYGWVIVQNATRIAANFAAANPDGWRGAGIQAIKDEYETQIERDLNTANCQAAATPPAPVYTDGPDTAVGGGYTDSSYDVGDTVVVNMSCAFRPITPIISAIVGTTVQLGARSEFRIRSGDLVGLANPTKIPSPNGSPTPTPTPGGTPTPTPTPSPTPTPTPTPICNVVPTVNGLAAPAAANAAITGAGLAANGLADLTTGPKNKAANQSPAPGICVAPGSAVTYHYRP